MVVTAHVVSFESSGSLWRDLMLKSCEVDCEGGREWVSLVSGEEIQQLPVNNPGNFSCEMLQFGVYSWVFLQAVLEFEVVE